MRVYFLCLVFGMVWCKPWLQVDFEELPTLTDNTEVTEGYFEGDIDLPKVRSVIRGANYKWPRNTVYYTISSSYPTATRNLILQAMKEIEDDTKHGTTYCVRFEQRTTQTDYINVHSGDGCHSKVGHQGGAQEVSIGSGCDTKGVVMHELLHALGFWHEHSRYDRDNYIVVHTDNVVTDSIHDFEKHTVSQVDTLGMNYDLGSIMHYGPYTFAKDKSKPTISVKPGQGSGVTMGQRLALSSEDVQQIQKLYGCVVDTSHITHPTYQYIVNCNFEADFCNLQQDKSDNFDWLRMSGSTPTLNTGPNADHTNGAGYYIYAEATNHLRQVTKLTTPTATRGEYCIDFWLFQGGSEEGSFQVWVGGPDVVAQAIKTITGDQDAEWNHFRINLNSPASFHLVLQANIGRGEHSDIAIDDFKFYKGRCL
ncbi:zinc metalloproteinase nas-4-like [Pomacea canaliculata]|uniref:zinc metalloproteinase nas-4-like n=1 Tax=Pomacea canaliculata TaxID=400727 RepID=UPI000D72E879|nr:zinc metalloproteinase nas-4-like [Pomacea canaliculata]